MGKILQILIIENRDLAHAQTFCTSVTSDVRSSKVMICVKVWLFSNQKHAYFLEISLNSSLIRLDQH